MKQSGLLATVYDPVLSTVEQVNVFLSCCLLCGMQPVVELPPGATDPLVDNKYQSVAVERDLRRHSLRRVLVIDPDPGDLSGRKRSACV